MIATTHYQVTHDSRRNLYRLAFIVGTVILVATWLDVFRIYFTQLQLQTEESALHKQHVDRLLNQQRCKDELQSLSQEIKEVTLAVKEQNRLQADDIAGIGEREKQCYRDVEQLQGVFVFNTYRIRHLRPMCNAEHVDITHDSKLDGAPCA
eukprot:m.60303 g.60303  ORF g.60303 m.60303 type:complete len:151 (+) comp11807_c0_seq4:104-556(+)